MGTSDPQNDAGEQWRSDLPGTWEECESYPPLAAGVTEEPKVIKQDNATVFQLRESATRWVQADNDVVLYPEDYR